MVALALGEKKTLFFLHIPRTGGTSLMQYLDRRFDENEICPAHEMFEFERLQRQNQLSGYAFYRGHFGINLPRLIDPAGWLITFLRRPISRVQSTWRHMRSQPVPFSGEAGGFVQRVQNLTVAAHELDFENFCYYVMRIQGPWFFNAMTALCGRGRGSKVLEASLVGPEEVLREAQRTLDGVAFIGFTETFDKSVEQMQRRFGWAAELIAPVNAAPPSGPPPSGKFLRWLEFATRLDQQLYDYAVQTQK